MELLVMEKHDGEGVFPLFKKGAAVQNVQPCEGTPHWCLCEIDGHKTYIAETYLANNVLLRDYDPTELAADKGQEVTLVDIVFEWLLVQNESGKIGWLPARKVVSVS